MGRYIEGLIPLLAAGTDWSFAPSPADRFRLVAVYGVLTTSATVANRQVALKATDRSGNVQFAKGIASVQAASTVIAYSWSSGSGPAEGGSTVEDAIVSDGVPDWHMPAGSIVKTVTANLAAGDVWSQLYYVALVDDARAVEARLLRLERELAG